MNKTTYFTLVMLTPARLCFAQDLRPAEPRLDALVALERENESAAARGDVAFLDRAIADDFVFTHGYAWTTGGKPSQVDTKKTWLATVGRWELVSHRTVPESAS